jgi:hypothetical protein
MGYLVQGFNPQTKQWESLPYQTEDFQTHYVWPVEYMAIEGMKSYSDIWPGEYRVVPCGSDDK